jgi:phosphate uptake regulator
MPLEIRKLQKTGGTTFFVSLPKQWVQEQRLKRGDPVTLIPRKDGTLIVDTRQSKPRELKSTEFAVGNNLFHDLIDRYMTGYDLITVRAEKRLSSDHRRIVRDVIRHLIGLEIVDEDAQSITLQCLVSTNAVPLIRNLKRTYKLAATMHQDAVNALLSQDEDLARTVIPRDDEVDRLYFLAVRQIRIAIQDPRTTEQTGITPLQYLDLRIAARSLEVIADQATTIADKALTLAKSKLPQRIITSLKKLSDHTRKTHNQAVEALWSSNTSLAAKIYRERTKFTPLRERTESFILRQDTKTATHLATVIDSLTRIHDAAVDLASLVVARY